MTSDIVVIAPDSKPGTGGVTDYTLRLLEQLPCRDDISLIGPSDFDQLPRSAGKVLVEYSAYGFDRLGYPRDLIRALIDWKRNTGGRLVVMFHEIWAFWPVTNKNYFVQLMHRRAIKKLLNHVDLAFTSTVSQAEHLRALNATPPVEALAVGSNIRLISGINSVREPGVAVLFGLQRARIRTLERMQSVLSQLAASGKITKLVTVGTGSGEEDEEFGLLSGLPCSQGFEQRGEQSEEAISILLATTSFGIFGQSELSYTKSGTFMAYAAHGLSILSELAGPTKAEPFCWLVSPSELIDGISQRKLQRRAEQLRDWQERTSSWKIIGAKIANALELTSAASIQTEVLRR